MSAKPMQFISVPVNTGSIFIVRYSDNIIRKCDFKSFLDVMCVSHEHNYGYKIIAPADVAKANGLYTPKDAAEECFYFALKTFIDAPASMNGHALKGMFDILWEGL